MTFSPPPSSRLGEGYGGTGHDQCEVGKGNSAAWYRTGRAGVGDEARFVNSKFYDEGESVVGSGCEVGFSVRGVFERISQKNVMKIK